MRKDVSAYKGVTFYKRTGRWEANLWYEKKQHYLGASYSALEAARAYDKAVLKTRGSSNELNFHPDNYEKDRSKMESLSFKDYQQYLRNTSRKTNCTLLGKPYKGILVDEARRWEVKYFDKNHIPNPRYVLVGWFHNQAEAVRAYNETAKIFDASRIPIKSFFMRKDTTVAVHTTLRSMADVRVDFNGESRLENDDVYRPIATANSGHEVAMEAVNYGTPLNYKESFHERIGHRSSGDGTEMSVGVYRPIATANSGHEVAMEARDYGTPLSYKEFLPERIGHRSSEDGTEMSSPLELLASMFLGSDLRLATVNVSSWTSTPCAANRNDLRHLRSGTGHDNYLSL